ncbi:MAG: DUF4260 family protein [Gemmatimonadales bacterium]|jgi:hypothetical protein
MRDPTRPALLLRLDGLVLAAVGLVLYRELGVSWWLFILVFLVPDLSILVYVVHRGIGARAYNLAHTYLWPGALFGLGFVAAHGWLMAVSLVWLIHIGLDRALGLGLKYPDAPFRETHLQRV